MSDWPPRRDRPYVKVCGLTRPDLAAAAVAAGADMIGLVHFAKSPRHLGFDRAREVAAAAKGASVVALTVDADDATLDAIDRRVRPDIFQLHGHETPEHVATVAARYGKPVIKAVGVRDAADIEAALSHDALLLLDAKPPKNASRPGGNGEAFDWGVLAAVPAGRAFVLAGGLNSENVADAVERTKPYAVDVSSGVETDGLKDTAKIRAFIAAVKQAALT
ncbi:MAG: phosphoribosylanthranilate isomerase [Pseudomonadota bacterium]